jgi:hypothetical protein
MLSWWYKPFYQLAPNFLKRSAVTHAVPCDDEARLYDLMLYFPRNRLYYYYYYSYYYYYYYYYLYYHSRDISFGIATRYGLDGPRSNSGGRDIFRTRPDQPWGLPSLLHKYRATLPGVKRPGCDVDNSHHLVPRLKKKQNYTSVPPVGIHSQ